MESLEQLVAEGLNLRVLCHHITCQRYAVFDAKELLALYRRKGWSTDWGKVPKHMRCTYCWSQAHHRGALTIEESRDAPHAAVSDRPRR